MIKKIVSYLKLRFTMEDFLDRMQAMMFGGLIALSIFIGNYWVAVLLLVFGSIDPKWFRE